MSGQHPIASLDKQMQNLRSEHDQLKMKHESFRDEASSRFSRYDANRKLTLDMFNCVKSDFDEFRNFQSKTNGEIKKLTKVSSTILSSIRPNKTYANALSKKNKATPATVDQNVQINLDEC